MTETRSKLKAAYPKEVEKIVLLVRFTLKPDKHDTFLRAFDQLVEKMREEDAFLDAVISQDVDRPDQLIMYETWLRTRETWLREELPRPYRAEYEGLLKDLLESRSVEWLTPLKTWSGKTRKG